MYYEVQLTSQGVVTVAVETIKQTLLKVAYFIPSIQHLLLLIGTWPYELVAAIAVHQASSFYTICSANGTLVSYVFIDRSVGLLVNSLYIICNFCVNVVCKMQLIQFQRRTGRCVWCWCKGVVNVSCNLGITVALRARVEVVFTDGLLMSPVMCFVEYFRCCWNCWLWLWSWFWHEEVEISNLKLYWLFPFSPFLERCWLTDVWIFNAAQVMWVLKLVELDQYGRFANLYCGVVIS